MGSLREEDRPKQRRRTKQCSASLMVEEVVIRVETSRVNKSTLDHRSRCRQSSHSHMQRSGPSKCGAERILSHFISQTPRIERSAQHLDLDSSMSTYLLGNCSSQSLAVTVKKPTSLLTSFHGANRLELIITTVFHQPSLTPPSPTPPSTCEVVHWLSTFRLLGPARPAVLGNSLGWKLGNWAPHTADCTLPSGVPTPVFEALRTLPKSRLLIRGG